VLVLTCIQGPDKGRTFQLPDHEPQLLGRSSEALPISDEGVSRRHAELTPDAGAWLIRDLSSQNGTYVNGVRIQDRVRLRPGDQIRVGNTLYVFGLTETRDPQVVRLLSGHEIDASVDLALPSMGVGMGAAAGTRPAAPTPGDTAAGLPSADATAEDHLAVFYRLTELLTTRVMDRQELLHHVMDLVFTDFRPERGFIVLVDQPADAPAGVVAMTGATAGATTSAPTSAASAPAIAAFAAGPSAARTGPPFQTAVVRYATPPRDPEDAKIHVSRTILQHVVARGEGILSSNAMSDPRFKGGDSVQRFGIRSALCAPIKLRDRTYGAIYIDSSAISSSFTPAQLALLNAIGRVAGLALANTDLVRQKLQAERLAAIGETMASLSHSVKNILQGLRGGADVLEMGLKKDDLKIAKGGWTILSRNIDRIMSLTMNMLAFSRQRRVEVELTRLGPLLEDVAQLLEGQCAARKVALIVDVDPEMPPVPVDASLIHQAVMNLVTNALEAVEPGNGAVTLRATYHAPPAPTTAAHAGTRGAEVRISVSDNGPGIPRDKLAWIFEPFNTTKGIRGTGLGLAVARRIAEEHRGRVEVDPGGPAPTGATFTLALPADPSNPIDPSATAGDRATRG
jgi:signal transduction histidine kinase